jgi:hypothetical protein
MLLVGEVRGIKSRKVSSDKGDFEFHYVIVEDGNMDSHQIQLNRDHDEKFIEKINALIGKVCSVPFYIRKFQGKNGANFSFNYDGDNPPIEYKNQASPMAAVAK